MLGIYSLIWTIGHKLMWLLSKCCFILHNFRHDAWQNLWLSGNTGTLTVNKMALPIEVSAMSYSYFYWKKYDCNWVTKLRSRYYCNMSRIRLRLMRCHWSFDPWWVKISGHTEQLRPCESTLHFISNRHSKSQNPGCILYWRFWPNWWSEKIQARNSQKSGVSYIRGASYIRDKAVFHSDRPTWEMIWKNIL